MSSYSSSVAGHVSQDVRTCAVDVAHRVYFGEENGIFELIADHASVKSVIGGGEVGYEEGSGRLARFAGVTSIVVHQPRASLFVCDSGNHVIREIIVQAEIGKSFRFLTMPCMSLALDSSFEFLFVGTGSALYRVTVQDRTSELFAGLPNGNTCSLLFGILLMFSFCSERSG